MNCEEALLLISGHIDHENTQEEEAQLQAHLETCETCRNTLAAFLEIDGELQILEEAPAGLCEDVMRAIRAEAPAKRKSRRLWPVLTTAAAMALVIGLVGVPMFRPNEKSAPAETTAAQTAETSVLMADSAAGDVICYSARSVTPAMPLELAEARGADVVVTRELLPEMEVCTCETLEDGSLLYQLQQKDDAVELSRIYGLELYQPAAYTAEHSYALLIS